ncbi:MAG: hypothetical protein JWO89_2019 [Verrucomicrobiaceae bacterium]|nr:hypothetical protein [Verrucomicrobiaceae bacterium]
MQITRTFSAVIAMTVWAAAEEPAPGGMVLIPGGSYKPLYAKAAKERVAPACFMDVTQVTNAQFLDFVRDHPEWRRSQVKRALADAGYLAHWAGDLDLGPQGDKLRNAPVTQVSWFAAKAYCEAQGKRLPTQDEWEFVARADATRADASKDQAYLNQLLEWYAKPPTSNLEAVRSAPLNVHGLRGLHGLVWEWVQDFNSTMIVGDSRGDGSLDRNLFCGAGSLLGADVSNYAAYMRYALRSSLKGDYCLGSLGFRAAKSVHAAPQGTASTTTSTTAYELPCEWRTQDGKIVTLSSLRGKVHVLTMGFTRCKFACPRTLGDMHSIEQALGTDADSVGFVFLSIDPQHDTPERMTQVISDRKLNPARWTFLTAPEDVVQQTAVALNFKFQMIEGLFAHSNLIAVLDKTGTIVHREEALGAALAPTIAAIRKLFAAP